MKRARASDVTCLHVIKSRAVLLIRKTACDTSLPVYEKEIMQCNVSKERQCATSHRLTPAQCVVAQVFRKRSKLNLINYKTRKTISTDYIAEILLKTMRKNMCHRHNRFQRSFMQQEKACCKRVSTSDDSVCLQRHPGARFESVVYGHWT